MGAVSDDEDEEPIVPTRQRRRQRATVGMSPSAPADRTTKRASGEATDSSHPSKRLHVMKDSHLAEPPKVTRGPARWPRPQSLAIIEHHYPTQPVATEFLPSVSTRTFCLFV
jgi:hypothetical protein